MGIFFQNQGPFILILKKGRGDLSTYPPPPPPLVTRLFGISDHLLQCNCTFDDFGILSTDSNKLKLLLRESLLVKRDKPISNGTIKLFSNITLSNFF